MSAHSIHLQDKRRKFPWIIRISYLEEIPADSRTCSTHPWYTRHRGSSHWRFTVFAHMRNPPSLKTFQLVNTLVQVLKIARVWSCVFVSHLNSRTFKRLPVCVKSLNKSIRQPKTAEWVANSIDPDATPRSSQAYPFEYILRLIFYMTNVVLSGLHVSL